MKVRNETRHPHATVVIADAEGREVLVVMVKATLRLGSGEPATEPEPVRLTDDFFPSGALRHPSDVSLDRPGTDVILHGTAYAPSGLAQPSFTAELRVADVRRTVRVFGRRTWTRGAGGPAISEPEPVQAQPLGFEHCFGGASFAENPVGVGLWSDAAESAPEGLELPRIEDDAALIETPASRPAPASFGAVAGHWAPRSLHAGTYGDAWRRSRAPLLPDDFDPRFFQAARPELVTAEPLVGGEPIELVQLTREGRLATMVPRLPLRVRLGNDWVRPRIDRLVIEPDAGRISVAYRAVVDVAHRVDRLPGVLITEKSVIARHGGDA